MRADFYNRQRIRRTGARLAVGAGLIAALAAIYAFRGLSARPGEAALKLMPADAQLVATIDLSPSASQTLAFKRIDDALTRNGMSGMAEGSILGLLEPQSEGVPELSKLILRNGAVGLLPGPDGTMSNPKGIGFLALSDGAAAQALLVQHGVPMWYKGVKYYKLKHGKNPLMVVGDLLLVGEDPISLYRVHDVQIGAKPSILSTASFASARSYVADDANVMLFMSPKALEGIGKSATGVVATSDWISMGLAVRDEGIGISCSGVVDPKVNPAVAKLGQIPPVRSDLFKILPAGAYGAFVGSQPSAYYDAYAPMIEKDKDAKKGLAQTRDSLEKQSGLNFDTDLLPAFKGNTIAALYPAEPGSAAGLDVLLVIDDANGGTPADAVDHFQEWMKKQSEKEGNQQGPLWSERTGAGAKFFRVADSIQSDMRKSMGQGMSEADVNRTALVDNKTIAWAFVGKTVLASTSQELLDRAVANYEAPSGGLDTDPKFAGSQAALMDGSQSLAMISLSRAAEGVKNTVRTAKMSPDARSMFDSVIGAFMGLDQPLTLHGKLQSDGRSSGGAFIPLDYEKLIDIAGAAMKKKQA